MRFRNALLLVTSIVIFFEAPRLMAQTSAMAVTSASITISPAATDSYTLQGTFSGLVLSDSAFISLSVGNFGADIPLTAFNQQGGVWTYQDSTGKAPYWISSLTLNWTAQTFQAQASGIVLAGLTNPFKVQLGAARSELCTMVRVQQSTPGTYQLTGSDPVGMTCEISNTPLAMPKVVMAGTATKVTLELNLPQGSTNGTLQNVQLFNADDNAQPVGNALCTLRVQANGDYTCTITINQGSTGMLPMLMQATVAGKPVLSPGFAIQVAEQPTAADVQQVSSIETVIMQGWKNVAQYGDTPYARTQTFLALRKLLSPPVELTAQPFGLALDGLSIYTRTNCGVPVTLPLVDVAEILASTTNPQGLPAVERDPEIGANRHIAGNRLSVSQFGPPIRGAGPDRSLECGAYPRDIVGNNSVLVWAPGTIWGFTHHREIAAVLQGSACPDFTTPPIKVLEGNSGGVAALSTFSNYGTIIMDSHGALDDQWSYLITGDVCFPCTASQFTGMAGVSGVACGGGSCFITVYPNNPNIQQLQNAIIYAGFCFGFRGNPGFRQAFVGANSTYIGYWYTSLDTDDDLYGVPLFDSLVNHYKSTGEAFDEVKSIAPPLGNRPSPIALGFEPYIQLYGDSNLAYVGNPQLVKTALNPAVPGVQGLGAYLEGAASCGTNGAPYMYVKWTNPATAGHLTPVTGGVIGGQDNFYNQASQAPPQGTPGTLVSDWAIAKYTPLPNLSKTGDNVMADFYPFLDNPVAARACLTVGGGGLFVESYLDTALDAANPESTSQVPTSFSPFLKVPPTFTAPFTDPNGYASQGASASVTVAASGNNVYTVTVAAGGAAPGAGNGPFEGIANVDLSAVNPGVAGVAKVQISGAFNAATISELSSCGSSPTCSFPDGEVYINGQEAARIATPGAVPFAITADSSTSPVDIYVSMNPNPASASPEVFTITLTITFINQ